MAQSIARQKMGKRKEFHEETKREGESYAEALARTDAGMRQPPGSTEIPNSPASSDSSEMPVEAVAEAICDAWGYDWNGTDEDDGQFVPETNAENYDLRPSRELYRDAAKRAIAAMRPDRERLIRERDEARGEVAEMLAMAEVSDHIMRGAVLGENEACAALAESHALAHYTGQRPAQYAAETAQEIAGGIRARSRTSKDGGT